MRRASVLIIAASLVVGLFAGVGCSSTDSARDKSEDIAQGAMKEQAKKVVEEGLEKAQEEDTAAEPAEEASAAAIDGYCPVAYKMMGEAVKGSPEFAVEHGGHTWHMANAEAMSAFEANPEGFAVKYDGWCAIGVSRGGRVEADPTIFMVHDDATYLFSSEEAKAKFAEQPEMAASKADEVYPSLNAEEGDL